MSPLTPPSQGDDWVGLSDAELPVAGAGEWAVLPRCGAVVTFSGTARDHAEDRPDVDRLEYEAYEEQVVPRLGEIAAEARRRWPDLGRLVLLHRVGVVPIGESSVVVVASAPHRDAAFEAARFGIDAVKATAPIWKRERWSGGESWGLAAQPVTSVGATATPTAKLEPTVDGPSRQSQDKQERVG
jgi:molybdopterin synthase catalytic subunit